MKRLALVALVWALSTDPTCQPFRLRLYDWYINGPYYGDHSEGYRDLSPTSTSHNLAGGKPMLDCVIAWLGPIAIDSAGVPLPAKCQPAMVSVDGQSWVGM